MLDITRFSSRYAVRYMNDSDADDILALCRENTQYYQYCGEKRLSKEGILLDLRVTPPDMVLDAKYYVGFFEKDTLTAILDLIDGYPDDASAFIGFFMVKRKLQGNQIGTGIMQELFGYLRETGKKRIFLGIDKGNPQSTHFWEKNGFCTVLETKQDGRTIIKARKTL